jgi:hypothetical protein
MGSRPDFGLSLISALAVVFLPLLPTEHVHLAGIEGRTRPLAHGHVLDVSGTPEASPARHSLVAPHGDHGLAVFLSTVYNGTARFAHQPMLLLDTLVTVAPPIRSPKSADPGRPQTTHGPPGPVWLTRGPPSLS